MWRDCTVRICIRITEENQGLFLSVLPKTQFPKNAKTQFENAKTQFENPKTQFGNCKTLENRQFYASHQNKFNSLNQFWCNQQKIILKPHFYKWVSWKTNSKNAKSQFEQAKVPPENPKTQFENAKTQKTAQVLAQVFLDRRSKKSPVKVMCEKWLKYTKPLLSIHLLKSFKSIFQKCSVVRWSVCFELQGRSNY